MTPAALRAKLWNPPNAVQEADGRPVGRFVPKVVIPLLPAPKPTRRPWLWPGNLTGEFWLSEDAPVPVPSEPMMADIKTAALQVFGVGILDLMSGRRLASVTVPRQIAMALCCFLTSNSLPAIGRVFDRDHTTVLHARNRMRPHYEAVALTIGPHATPREWVAAMKARLA